MYHGDMKKKVQKTRFKSFLYITVPIIIVLQCIILFFIIQYFRTPKITIPLTNTENSYEQLSEEEKQEIQKQANNTQRRSDVNAIVNSLHQYAADNGGTFPSVLGTEKKMISSQGYDICSVLVPYYLAALPTDPLSASEGEYIVESSCGSYETDYFIRLTGNNKVEVSAPNSELGEEIVVTR